MADTPNPTQPAEATRWTPSLPTNLAQFFSSFSATTTEDPAKTSPPQEVSQKPTYDSSQSSTLAFFKRPILAAVAYNTTVSRQSSMSKSTDSIMYAEPDLPSPTESGSRENSVDGSRRARKGNRPKTRYSVCHPPPSSTTRQKLHRRPRPLLQLHRLSPHSRPLPAYEVVSTANFSVRLTRAITKVFTARHGLCMNDLVLLQAESYRGEETDEEQEERNVIGLICRGRKDDDAAVAGRIYTARGQEWEAYYHSTGNYEFSTTDEHGLALTVRWVPKRYKDESRAPKDGLRTFNFSTISPHTRRHPVIASLSKASLEINDRYKMPDPAAATPLSTPQQNGSLLADTMNEEAGGDHMYETDDVLREIITLTSVWVTIREGWSVALKSDDPKDKDCCNPPSSPMRSVASDATTPPVSPSMSAADKRSSLKSFSSGILRRSSLLSSGNAAHHHAHNLSQSRLSITSNSGLDSPSRSPSIRSAGVAGPTSTGRARSDSSSTVLVQRAASNRRKNSVAARSSRRMSHHLDQTVEASREDLSRASFPVDHAGPAKPGNASHPSSADSDPEPEDEDEPDETDTTEDEDPVPADRKKAAPPPPSPSTSPSGDDAKQSVGRASPPLRKDSAVQRGSRLGHERKGSARAQTKPKKRSRTSAVIRRLLCAGSSRDA